MRDRLLALAVAVPFLIGTLAVASAGESDVVFRFQDPEIVESSGLVVQDGVFWTTNDSGDRGRVFAVDPATGRTVGVTEWSGAPTDVEALAPAGPGAVWVGDIGDNSAVRDSVSVARVPVGEGARDVDVASHELVYPDGPRDAEALLAHPVTGRLYVVSKVVFGGSLYAAPRTLAGTGNRLAELGRVMPIVTDGAFFPDGRHLVLRDYGRMVVYTFPGLEAVADVTLPEQRQGEGIAVSADGRVYVSSEGRRAPVYEVPLPAAVRGVVQEEAEPTVEPSATPSDAGPPPGPPPGSRADTELPQATDPERPWWPWLLTGGVGAVVVVVLLRSLRPR